MSNSRNSELLERGYLQVNKVSEQNGRITLRAYLFDNSPFEFTVHEHEYEPQSEGSAGLVPISIVGTIGKNYTEIMLPAPALSYGYNVRVSPTAVVSWELHNLKKGGK